MQHIFFPLKNIHKHTWKLSLRCLESIQWCEYPSQTVVTVLAALSLITSTHHHPPPVSKHAMWHDDDDTLWKYQYGTSPVTCTHGEHITGLQKHWQPTWFPAGCAAILAVSRKQVMLEAAIVPLWFSANWEMFGEELPVLTKHIYTHTHTHFSIVIMWAGDSDVGVTECVSPAKLLTLFSPQHLQTLGSFSSIHSFIINYFFQLCSFTSFKDIFQFALFNFCESVFLL